MNRAFAVVVTALLLAAQGRIIATKGMFTTTTPPPEEVEDGAIADPSYFAGRASVVDILPGQQPTATDFAAP